MEKFYRHGILDSIWYASLTPPAEDLISSESPNASASDALKDSPPDSVQTLRTDPFP